MPDGPGTGGPDQQASEELGEQLIEVIELFEHAADVYERGDLKHQQEGVALAAQAAYALVYLLG